MKPKPGTLRWAVASLFLLLMAGAVWAQSEPPSVADAARQKKSGAKARKVYTDEDIPSRPPEPSTASDNTAKAPGAEAAGSDASKPAEGDAAKASTPASADDRQAALKKDKASLESMLERMRSRLADETDDNRRKIWREAAERIQIQLDQNAKDLEQAEKDKTKDKSKDSESSANAPPK